MSARTVYQKAFVPKAKITKYLLSFTHRDGRSKAEFFTRFGFSADAWEELVRVLRHHAATHNVKQIEDSPFGTRYIIEGIIQTPDGRTPVIRSIWFVEAGEEIPRFVTAYPVGGKNR